jgi:tRNA pseudouridine55 synthase
MPPEISGLFLVDKPAGPSSFGVLRSLRPALGRKLGHAGTLDPFATGLLLVLAGRATRLAAFLSGMDKAYRATVQLGATSTTLDPEGTLTETGRAPSEDALRAAAAAMVGEIEQAVPAASAVRVDGQRAYARMRRGEAVAPPPRRVRIDRLDVVDFDAGDRRAEIEVACSKGTYVRQVAADLGDASGAGGYCLALRRLAVGPFHVEQAGTPEQVAADPDGPWRRDPAAALAHLPARELTEGERAAVAHGRPIAAAGERGTVALVALGELVAVAEADEERLRPVAVFA